MSNLKWFQLIRSLFFPPHPSIFRPYSQTGDEISILTTEIDVHMRAFHEFEHQRDDGDTTLTAEDDKCDYEDDGSLLVFNTHIDGASFLTNFLNVVRVCIRGVHTARCEHIITTST